MKHFLHFAFLTFFAALSISISRPATIQAQTSGFAPQHSEDGAQPAPVPMSGAWQSHPVGARNYWGIEAGITYNWLQNATNFAYGLIGPAASSPTGTEIQLVLPFADPGKGIGFIVGGVVDFGLSNSLALQGKLRFVNSSFSGDDTRTAAVQNSPTFVREVSHQSTSVDYLDLDALLRFQLSPNSVYLLGGFGFSTLVANSLSLTKTIDSAAPSVSFADENGAVTGLTTLSGTASLSGIYNTTRVALRVGVGTFIPIGTSGNVLTPELMFDIPLTTLYNQTFNDAATVRGATAPSLWHIDLTLAYKFPWGSATPGVSNTELDNSTSDAAGERNADNMVVLKGKVNDNNGNPVDADMTVVDLSDNQIVSTGKTNDGSYALPVKGPGKYSVTADANGYLFGTSYFEVDDEGRILKGKHDITLSPAADGRTRLLVFFDFAADKLQNASYPELDRAVRLMKANPGMSVEIAGYTDSKGTDSYNVDLSNRRAQAVRNYLVRNGIESSRVSPKGYGKQDPIATNDTEDGRAENRRVEFVVMHR